MKCKICGNEINDDSNFCPHCGETVKKIEKIICSKCGKELELSSDIVYCSNCGKKIKEEEKLVCSKCGKELDSDSKFCKYCGNNLFKENIKCLKCGMEVTSDSNFCSNCGFDFKAERKELASKMVNILSKMSKSSTDLNNNKKSEIINTIESYISKINDNKTNTVYKSTDIMLDKNIHIINTIQEKIGFGVFKSNIVAFIDTSPFHDGISGLLFSTDSMYEVGLGGSVKLPYDEATSMIIENEYTLYFGLNKGEATGQRKGENLFIFSTYYNLKAIQSCMQDLNKIILKYRKSLNEM